MSSLGIYFGPKLIQVVEAKGKRVVNNIRIPLTTLATAELEEKVPDEVKIVALFKDELRRNRFTAKQTNIVLSGQDLIIRTFDMPVIRGEDLANAINFEARKYIPFKIEDLILDYQLYFDKATQRNLILLVGIKKEILDKHISIFGQLNLEIKSVEYAAFSALRLLKLSGAREKGIVAIVSGDLSEQDEVNFVVLQDGFPLFSRDIILSGGPERAPKTEEADSGMLLEKFKTEIRISLDYYNRKFPIKKIDRTLFILNQDYQPDLETFAKEIGIGIKFLDVKRCLDKPVPFSLSFLKGYSGSLAGVVRTTLKINLLSARVKAAREAGLGVSLAKGLRVEPRIIILAILICLGALALGLFQRLPLQRELNDIRNMRPRVSTVNPNATDKELSDIDSEYKLKIKALDNFIRKQLYLTEPLDVIPRIIPAGMWLTDFSFTKEERADAELILEGMVSLGDANKEFELVNSFVAKLKDDPVFAKDFKEINIVLLDHNLLQNITVTNFKISCVSPYKERE